MAIQNFLSGGYYGKLGATVGQRWKNKRTIRTYVIPANPRTEVQQANRGKFANAVVFAQMGLQMNYYATIFEDPNFTRWNYRMKVARELKDKGMLDLDLIPLYPTSFVPPTLIQSIKVSGAQGTKHITFAVEGLTSNVDRVLSLMFAIYDENDTFLGYKLYLGYYYASNPGFLEVDVDDISEINKHCYVRAVSNDDIDSATDMIASPRLQVQTREIDIRAFNTSIKEVQKSLAGITVIFNEMWKGDPTTNNISILASFVSNGKKTNAHGAKLSLENNNGYCSVTIPFIVTDNQHLPAFPEGSNFIIEKVAYEGSTWQYTKENDTIAYNDTDLSRDFVSTISSVSRYGTTFTVTFDETLPTITTHTLKLAIRAVKNGAWVEEEVTPASISLNEVTFEQSDVDNGNIYAFPEGSTIAISGTIIGNGITYTPNTTTAQSVSNTDLNRNIAFSPAWDAKSTSAISFTIPFGGTVANANSNMAMICSGRFDKRDAITQAFSYVGNGSNLTFTCTGDFKNYPMSTNGDKITIPQLQFTCNGVTYTLAGGVVNLRNAIKTSNWLSNSLVKSRFTKDTVSGSPLKVTRLNISFSGLVMDSDLTTSINWVKGITNLNSVNFTPYDQSVSNDNTNPNNAELYVNAEFDVGDSNNKFSGNSVVNYATSNNTITYKGITYNLPTAPARLSGYITN